MSGIYCQGTMSSCSKMLENACFTTDILAFQKFWESTDMLCYTDSGAT